MACEHCGSGFVDDLVRERELLRGEVARWTAKVKEYEVRLEAVRYAAAGGVPVQHANGTIAIRSLDAKPWNGCQTEGHAQQGCPELSLAEPIAAPANGHGNPFLGEPEPVEEPIEGRGLPSLEHEISELLGSVLAAVRLKTATGRRAQELDVAAQRLYECRGEARKPNMQGSARIKFEAVKVLLKK